MERILGAMKDLKVTIVTRGYFRQTAEQAAQVFAEYEGDEILASTPLQTANGKEGCIQAIKRPNNGTVFARLIEWSPIDDKFMRLEVYDEPEGFPLHRLASLEVLARLSPTTETEHLIWRDRSRHALAEAGAFGNKMDNSANNAGSNADVAPQRERVRDRQDRAQPRERREREETERDGGARRHEKKRLRILIDRAPEWRTSDASGSRFLKLSGFAVEGVKTFVTLIVYAPIAAALESNLAEAMQNGVASLTVEATQQRFAGKNNNFRIASVLEVAPTQEQIPAKDHTRRPDQGETQDRRPRGQAEPAL